MWTNEVVAMIIAHLLSDAYLRFVITRLACSVEEILWKKLASFVELIIGTLCASYVYVNHIRDEDPLRRT